MKIEDLQEVIKLNRKLNYLKNIKKALSETGLRSDFQVSCNQICDNVIEITTKERQESILDLLRAEIDAQVTETETALNRLL